MLEKSELRSVYLFFFVYTECLRMEEVICSTYTDLAGFGQNALQITEQNIKRLPKVQYI